MGKCGLDPATYARGCHNLVIFQGPVERSRGWHRSCITLDIFRGSHRLTPRTGTSDKNAGDRMSQCQGRHGPGGPPGVGQDVPLSSGRGNSHGEDAATAGCQASGTMAQAGSRRAGRPDQRRDAGLRDGVVRKGCRPSRREAKLIFTERYQHGSNKRGQESHAPGGVNQQGREVRPTAECRLSGR